MTFFKVPLTKLALELRNDVNPNENIVFNRSQQGMIQGLEENRFWVHISARRTGKSYAAAILALGKLLEPGSQVMVVAPNYSLSSIIWDYVTGFIKQLEIETEKFNQKDKVVKLINGSTFRLLSANNRDSLVGRAAHLLIIDEAAVIENDEYFTRDLRPALSTFKGSRALFISTPRGKNNYIYDYFIRGSDPEFRDWGSAKYDWTASPLLNKEDIEEAKKSISNSFFLQEYCCEWTVFEGQIYTVDADKHVKDLSAIKPKDPRFDFIAGLDMGYRDETAFLVIATDGKRYYVVASYITSEAVTSAHAEVIKDLSEEWGIENIYIDASAAQTRADLAYDYDIYCDNAIKSVTDGINFIQNLVEQDKIEFDMTNCYNVFQNMAAYRWNTKTENPKPIHGPDSHACDALRYAIYTHEKAKIGIYTGE